MALGDVSRLVHFGHAHAHGLLKRLGEVGVTAEALRPYSELCQKLPERLRRPIRRWHLRRADAPRGPILRAFFFGDPVAEDELHSALDSSELFDALVSAGLLAKDADGVVCPLRLNLVDQLFFFADDLTEGGETVMGAGATTVGLIQAAWPSKPVHSILDMGCGAGATALLMAGLADQVVGIDINPRALAIAKLNALLAGKDNVEFLQSDFFSAVPDRKFDLIVSQPPFVSRPPEAEDITFLYGGSRGDELALRLIEQIPSHLAPGGRAVLLVDWADYDDASPTERLRRVLGGNAVDVLVLLAAPKSLDEHVIHYGSMMAPSLGAEFEQCVLTHREHLQRMNITELRLALIVLRRTEKEPWSRVVETQAFAKAKPTSAQLSRMMAVEDLLAADRDALLAVSLVIPPGAKFVEQEDRSVRVELPESRLGTSVVTSRAGADLLLEVDRAPSVAAAVEAIFERFPQLRKGGVESVLGGVSNALQSGLLEVASLES